MIGLLKINNYKFDLVQEIKRILEPVVWESGFIENPFAGFNTPPGEKKPDTVYTRLYVFGEDDDGAAFAHVDDYTGLTIEGFTTKGIITDSFGAICVKDYEDCMLEELVFALKIARTIGK